MSSYDDETYDVTHNSVAEPAPTPAPAPDQTGDDGPDDDDDDDDDDSDPVAGTGHPAEVIGPAGIGDLMHCAERLGQLAHATATRVGDLGDRIGQIADELRALANEARRRLGVDELPDDAGLPDQRDRIEAERRRRAADATDVEPPS